MAWNEHIHIHIHNEGLDKIIELLKDIKCLLSNDNEIPQEIMDKLDTAIADIKGTIQ